MEFDPKKVGERLSTARGRRGWGSAELDINAEVGRGTTSRLESASSPEVSMMIVAKIAHALGVRLDWLVFGRGDMWASNDLAPAPDLPAASFLMKLDRLPGLRKWIEDHPGEFHVSTIARGIEQYEKFPPHSSSALQSDGVPKGGWGAFLTDIDKIGAREIRDGTLKVRAVTRRMAGRRPKIQRPKD